MLFAGAQQINQSQQRRRTLIVGVFTLDGFAPSRHRHLPPPLPAGKWCPLRQTGVLRLLRTNGVGGWGGAVVQLRNRQRTRGDKAEVDKFINDNNEDEVDDNINN